MILLVDLSSFGVSESIMDSRRLGGMSRGGLCKLSEIIAIFLVAMGLPTISNAQEATAAASQDKTWNAAFSTDVRYFWMASKGGIDRQVQQVYAPVGLQVSGKPNDDWRFDFLTRSGALTSRTRIPGGIGNGSYSGITDTTVGATATYLSLNGIQPFLSLNVNMPTGNSVLRGAASNARNVDSDVVDAPSFGEGWNVGTTLGATIAFDSNFYLTVSAGYTARGVYSREGFNAKTGSDLNRFNPADTFVGSIDASYSTGAWAFSLGTSYGSETATVVDGDRFYRSGDRISANTSVAYAWSEQWKSKIALQFTNMRKNQIINPAVSLVSLVMEDFNSNSNVTRATFETTYSDGRFSITPVFGWLYRDRNAYDGTNFRFLPAKTKLWVGVAGEYSVTEQVSLSGRLERMWLRENTNPDKILFGPPPLPGSGRNATSTDGWMASIASTVRF